MRTLFARDHKTIYPGKGVFLAGPTPPDGEMGNGWRRRVIAELELQKLDDEVVIVVPEPENGFWDSILSPSSAPESVTENDQIGWELQSLQLCDVTAFWLPTYWSTESAGVYPANIGPTTRWEFGFLLQRYLAAPCKHTFILGGPSDAQSVGWARHISHHHNIPWHELAASEKQQLVSNSFIEAIVQAVTPKTAT